jgi:Spy/CpxP family protein refolding chaperone
MRQKYKSLVIALALSSSAWSVTFPQENESQRNPVGLGQLPNPTVMLKSRTVRKELKLTEEQEQKVDAVIQKFREARNTRGLGTPSRQEFAKLSKEQRKARLDELSKMLDEADRDLTAILAIEQQSRLKQIQFWIDQEAALFSAEVVAELKLVSVQTDALREIWSKYEQKTKDKVSEIRASEKANETRRKIHEAREKFRKEASEEYRGVLTEEQRAQFDKMCGPKFEVDSSEFAE